MKSKFVKELIKIFADKTGCTTQFNNCPCNTCFHSIDNKKDWNHITWLIVLGLRGDYNDEEILNAIREEVSQ